ncbi:hypothetical protein ACWC4D_33835 [Streptomyces sp. NPDC001288]
MAVRSSAAAVLAVAVVVFVLVRRDRRLRRRAAASRLMAGCLARDLDGFERRVSRVMAEQAVTAAAGRVLDESLDRFDPTFPPMEGGPR